MGKVQAIKAGLNLFRTRTVSVSSKRLFSFAQRHKFKTSGGGLSEDGLILTHLSYHPPRNGFIDTARSGAGMSRDSVHFAVNHGVQAHVGGAWNSCDYAVLMPMSSARQTVGNKFAGGIAADFYSKGKVKIPKGSVIVRRSASIPEGKYRISDASKIKEFKELHGVMVIETSSMDMVSDVNNIIRRLGYKVKSGGFTWGDSLHDFNLFNSFLRANGMKPMMHTYTPNGKIEVLIEHLQVRAKKLSDWTVKDKMGEVIFDYRQEYLQSLKYIEKFANETGFPKDFDTKQLAEIIRTSATPQEAMKLIEAKFKIIKSMNVLQSEASELELLQGFRMLVGGSKSAQISDNLVCEFLRKPNKTRLQKIQKAPVALETVPEQLMVQNPALRSSVTEIAGQYGLKLDNTVANRLYELG